MSVWEAARYSRYLLHPCSQVTALPTTHRRGADLLSGEEEIEGLCLGGHQGPYWQQENSTQVWFHSLKPSASSQLDPQNDGRQIFLLQAEDCTSLLWRISSAQEKRLKATAEVPRWSSPASPAHSQAHHEQAPPASMELPSTFRCPRIKASQMNGQPTIHRASEESH